MSKHSSSIFMELDSELIVELEEEITKKLIQMPELSMGLQNARFTFKDGTTKTYIILEGKFLCKKRRSEQFNSKNVVKVECLKHNFM